VIAAEERRKMLAVLLCGERVLMRLEPIGVEGLPTCAAAILGISCMRSS